MVLRRPAVAAIVGVTSMSLMLSGCGGQARTGSPASPVAQQPSLQTSPSPSQSEIAERDAVAAYRGFVAAWVDAAKVADPDAPALRQYSQGYALKLVVNAMFGNRLEQKFIRGEPVIDPKVADATPIEAPTRVTMSDCFDSAGWLAYKASGELWNDVPGGRRLTTSVLAKTDEGWKVESMSAEPNGSC